MYETAAEQQRPIQEAQRSDQIDLHVVDTFPRDHVEEFDRQERYTDDAETWLAEVLDGSMRSRFDFDFDGEELYAKDGGALGEVFDATIKSTQAIVQKNPSLLFELKRNIIEKGEYEDMCAMAKGELLDEEGKQVNVIAVTSDFPLELMSASKDIGGYNTSRQQTMLRIISRHEDGSVSITSQSLDRSNRQALEAIHRKLGSEPEAGELLGQRIALSMPEEWHGQLVDNLTDTYDQSLAEQHGGEWHAGIRKEQVSAMNTYEFARAQTDLVDWFVQEKMKDSHGAEKLRFKLAATASKRWRDYCAGRREAEVQTSPNQEHVDRTSIQQQLAYEMEIAATIAQASGETFSGCGASVSGPGVIGELRGLGYGSLIEEDEKGPLIFECNKGHLNERPRGKLLNACTTCNDDGDSLRC